MPTYKPGKTYLLNQPSTTNWTCRILENPVTLTEWLRPYTHKRYSQKACICKGTIFAPFWKWLRAICHLVKQEGPEHDDSEHQDLACLRCLPPFVAPISVQCLRGLNQLFRAFFISADFHAMYFSWRALPQHSSNIHGHPN